VKRAAKAAGPSEAKASAGSPAKSAPQKALEKLGLKRDIDLALHLPLRYEDETRITAWPMRARRHGADRGRGDGQRGGFRPRRQLLVTVNDAATPACCAS